MSPLRAAAARVREAFLGPADAESLNLFRALYCASLALTLWLDPYHGATLERLARHPELYRPIRLFELLGIGALSPEAFSLLRAGLLAALLAAAAGLATRLSLTASWAGFFLYYGTVFGARKPPVTDKIGYKTDAAIFVLLVLSLAPGIARWGLDAWRRGRRERGAIPAWPLQTVKLLLVLIYLGAGACKLRETLSWADGRTLQAYLLENAMANDNALGLALAGKLWACTALSWLTLALEFSFAAVLFWPRLAWVWVLGGLGMHAVMQLTMDKTYFQYFVLPYLAFLSWPGAAPSGRPASPDGLGPRAATGLIAALAAANLWFMAFKVEAWPCSPWRFFCERKELAQAAGYRLKVVGADGGERWLTPRELRGAHFVNDFAMRQVLRTGDEGWLRAQLAAHLSHLPPESLDGAARVEVVRRSARAGDGGFVFEDAAVLRHELGGKRAR